MEIRHGPSDRAVPESQKREPASRRPFVATAYVPAGDGRLVAARTARCPVAEKSDAPCAVGAHHRRERKTGPCFPLEVARCATHRRAFTLYPPGHRPYGRVAVAPVSSHGELLLTSGPEATAGPSSAPPTTPGPTMPGPETPPAPPRLAWSETMFRAALDAARGSAWPRCSGGTPPAPGYWNTQRRALVQGARVLGLHVETPARARESIARELSIPTLVLLDASHAWASAGGYRARGAAISSVLDRLTARRGLVDGLLASGTIAGLWGRPSRWDPCGSTLARPRVPDP